MENKTCAVGDVYNARVQARCMAITLRVRQACVRVFARIVHEMDMLPARVYAVTKHPCICFMTIPFAVLVSLAAGQASKYGEVTQLPESLILREDSE